MYIVSRIADYIVYFLALRFIKLEDNKKKPS